MKKYNSVHFIGVRSLLEDSINDANRSFKNFQETLEKLKGCKILFVNTNLVFVNDLYRYTILVTYSILIND